jgi:hypothetical protein
LLGFVIILNSRKYCINKLKMNETKLKDRIKNAAEALFADEPKNEPDSLAFVGNTQLTQIPQTSNLEQIADKYWGVFKKAFAYFPGILFLHISAVSTVEFGISIWGLFWILAGIFLVWAGIGDLKKTKHLLMPLSALLIGFIFALPFAFLPFDIVVNLYNYIYIGILPLLFIAPILTKSYLDKNEDS